MTMVIASNRLPVSLAVRGATLELEPTSGGLVSALQNIGGDRVWIGWPGATVPVSSEAEAADRLAGIGMRPVFLDAAEEHDFYGRVCNDTLWPLFHYFGDRLRSTPEAWETYRRVNERFADAIADAAEPGATVWIHDFHLMLVPALLRERRPDTTIGFFLHIPFPSSEVYRLLPGRAEVLRGLLGADYVSFHTREYANHFQSSCLRVLGLDSTPESISVGDRTVTIGVDPIGIDVDGFRESLGADRTRELHETLDCRYRERRLVLGVERLDYTKGIPQKLLAFERYLERNPEEIARTTMLQVLVPSRLGSPEYQELRREIEREIARINGRFAQPGVTPIEYLHRSIPRDELVAMYRRADAMLVTPLRDGMNLVAQEFALVQAEQGPGEQHRGALVLSEFAGAAKVLPGALLVNPWDLDGMVERLGEALALPAAERARRSELLGKRVNELAADRWASLYLRRLRRSAGLVPTPTLPRLDGERLASVAHRFRSAPERTLLVDYDGTLREFEQVPGLAAPTSEIVHLLDRLSALPATQVHVLSGRREDELDEWFSDLPVHLCAEHGLSTRSPEGDWRRIAEPDLSWLPSVRRLLLRVAHDVPGATVEMKQAGVAWHWREADPEYGAWRARELRLLLSRHLQGTSAEVVTDARVVEVKPQSVNRAAYARRLAARGALSASTFVLAADDDALEKDLLDVLESDAVIVVVGSRARSSRQRSCERYRVEAASELRAALTTMAAALETSAPLALAGSR